MTPKASGGAGGSAFKSGLTPRASAKSGMTPNNRAAEAGSLEMGMFIATPKNSSKISIANRLKDE